MNESSGLTGASPELRTIYDAVRHDVSGWPGVGVFPTGSFIEYRYRGSKGTLDFVEVHPQNPSGCLILALRREATDLQPGTAATVLGLEVQKVPDSHGWTAMDHRVAVSGEAQLGSAVQMIRRHHEAVRSEIGT